MTARFYALEDGRWLVVSPAGVQTIVYGALAPGPSAPERVSTRLRALADAIDEAAVATAPMRRAWIAIDAAFAHSEFKWF